MTSSRCKLPHTFAGTTFSDTNNETTVFQPLLCATHLQYMYGLAESDVKMQATDFTKIITNEYMYSGRRGYTLFARQSWRTGDECDTLVFTKGDIIFPTSEKMSNVLQQLENESEAIKLLTTESGVCSRPITKFLRKIKLHRKHQPAEMLQSCSTMENASANLSRLEEDVGIEARDEVIAQLHQFYYAHAFYPLRNAFDSGVEPELAKHYYFRSLWRDLKLSYEVAETVRDFIANLYAPIVPEHHERYSGQFWRALKGIDVPVGRDIDRDPRPKCGNQVNSVVSQQRNGNESACPESARAFISVDKHLWQAKSWPAGTARPFYFTHSLSIPNCEFDPDKGFVATRDIYHDEELSLEPPDNRSNHVPISSWAIVNLLRKKPSDICSSANTQQQYSRARLTQQQDDIQTPYSSEYHVRGRCLSAII